MLDRTALPRIPSHCCDDTALGQQICSQSLTLLSHQDLPTMGMPLFLQVPNAACANSFLLLLPWVGGIAPVRRSLAGGIPVPD